MMKTLKTNTSLALIKLLVKPFSLRSFVIAMITLFGWNATLQAQTLITPAGKQEKSIVVKNATIHVGDGTVIENGALLFSNGKIDFVGITEKLPSSAANATVIDAKGKQLYPGFIQSNSTVGLQEVDAVKATRDAQEIGPLNPNVRTLIAFNTDSELISTMRFNGVLTAQVSPNGGLVSGRSSIFRFEGWNWEDAVLKSDDGLFIRWPERTRLAFDWSTFTRIEKPNERYNQQVLMIKQMFAEAKAFKNDPAKPNLKLAAVKPVFNGKTKVYVRVNKSFYILEAIKSLKALGIENIVIVGGRDAVLVAETLVKENIPVIYESVNALPYTRSANVENNFDTPVKLIKAGVLVGLGVEGWPMNSRNLPFQAGQMVPFGLTKEEALQTITINNAKILGIEEMLGSLKAGKFATFFISDGDALDMGGNIISQAFVEGKSIELEGTQQILYKKYHKKYTGK